MQKITIPLKDSAGSAGVYITYLLLVLNAAFAGFSLSYAAPGRFYATLCMIALNVCALALTIWKRDRIRLYRAQYVFLFDAVFWFFTGLKLFGVLMLPLAFSGFVLFAAPLLTISAAGIAAGSPRRINLSWNDIKDVSLSSSNKVVVAMKNGTDVQFEPEQQYAPGQLSEALDGIRPK